VQAWRGITPLLSTRDDVKRLLGAPTKKVRGAYYYALTDELVSVAFQEEPCDGESGLGLLGYGWNVPVGTVTVVSVIPKAKSGKEKFLAEGDFSADDTGAGFVYYTKAGGGLSVETLNGSVTLVIYAPTAKENVTHHCPQVEECCMDFFPKFDEYVELSFEDEKARLDNYAVQLQTSLSRGVITAYGQSPEERSRLMKREERAREYLAQKHGVEPQRIMIVDGGYQKTPAVGLYLYSLGGYWSRIHVERQPDPAERGKSAN